MGHNVFANGMEVSCKASSGKTICNFPDVCLSPPSPPAGPIPIPYPNTGMASNTSEGSTTVKIAGKEVMLKNKSCFSKSTGDEAATKTLGMGVVTHQITGKVYFNAWSMNVKVEGQNVPRHLDLTTNNHMSKMPGNTPPMPHVSSMSMGMPPSVPPCKAAPGAGNPVNPVVGCKFLTGDDDCDFALEGPLDLKWQRQYFSDNPRVGWLGQGWMLPFEVYAEIGPLEVALVDSQGRRLSFKFLNVGEGVYLPTERCWIRRLDVQHLAWDMPEGVRMLFAGSGVNSPADSERLDLVAIRDRNGNEHRLIRIDDQNLAIRASGGQIIRLRFSPIGRLVRVSQLEPGTELPAGIAASAETPGEVTLVTYEFDERGDLITVRSRSGDISRRFEWNNHMMVSHVTAVGLISRYEWDELSPRGKVIRFTTNDGKVHLFEYGPSGTVITDELGRRETFLKDAAGRWVGVIDAEGGEHRRVLDEHGSVIALVEPSGKAYVSRLNDRGLPEETVAPDGTRTQAEWHAEFDLPTTVADPLGRVAIYQYDERGNLVRQVSRDGTTVEYIVDARGLVVTTIDEEGGRERIEYNEQGQPVLFVDSSGKETRLTYDANGWLTSITDALGQITRFRYDAMGNCVAEIDENGAETAFSYDAGGRLTAAVDPDGNRTTFVLRLDGQPRSRTDPEGFILRYDYDVAGRLVGLVNENGSAYRFDYDSLDRMTRQSNVDGTSITYTYGISGLPTDVVEEGTDRSRIHHVLEFDDVGQLLAIRSNEEEALFSYDAVGNILTATNATTRVALEYDDMDRIVAESVSHRHGPSVVRYAYDKIGNCIRMQLSDGRDIEYLRHDAGHLHQINIGKRLIIKTELDDLHREVARTQGRLGTRYKYDRVGRLIEQNTSLVAEFTPQPGQGSPGADWTRVYAYSRNGNLQRAVSGPVQRAFAYDRSDRLARHVSNRVSERFLFDPASNLIDALGQRVADDRVARRQGLAYSFDGFGRVVSKTGSPRGDLRLLWNNRHEVTYVETRHSGGRTTTTRYDYDAFGRRVAKIDTAGATRFVWDGDQLLEEIRGAQIVSYIYSPGTYDAIASLVRPHQDAAELSAEQRDNNADVAIFYYHTDSSGTPERLSNEEGRWVWSAHYAAYGNIVGSDLEIVQPAPVIQPLRFQGQYFDAETGLHYNRHRYFDPDVGRFLSPDPIGLEGGTNVYLYCPNPISWIDPEGLLSYPLPPIPRFQQHHIIPQQLQNHPALKKAGFDIHDESNIIYLPKCEAAHPTKTIHRGSHPKYTKNVRKRLDKIAKLGKQRGWSKARYQQAIKDEIAKLRRGLNRGTTKLNKNSYRTGKCTTCGC